MVLISIFIPDGFTPFFQDVMIDRLRSLVEEDGVLFLIGQEPYTTNPDQYRTLTSGGQLAADVYRLRDSCIQLAGNFHREFPSEWVVRQLERTGFQVEQMLHMPIVIDEQRRKSALVSNIIHTHEVHCPVTEHLNACRRVISTRLSEDRVSARHVENMLYRFRKQVCR